MGRGNELEQSQAVPVHTWFLTNANDLFTSKEKNPINLIDIYRKDPWAALCFMFIVFEGYSCI